MDEGNWTDISVDHGDGDVTEMFQHTSGARVWCTPWIADDDAFVLWHWCKDSVGRGPTEKAKPTREEAMAAALGEVNAP